MEGLTTVVSLTGLGGSVWQDISSKVKLVCTDASTWQGVDVVRIGSWSHTSAAPSSNEFKELGSITGISWSNATG